LGIVRLIGLLVPGVGNRAGGDANVKQGPTFTGDAHYDATAGVASDIWLVRDAPAVEFRVYLKLMKQTADRQATHARVNILLTLDQPVEVPEV
jgi:hypothetical protein